MRNEHVQSAAANAAQGAAKGMASQYGSNNKYWTQPELSQPKFQK